MEENMNNRGSYWTSCVFLESISLILLICGILTLPINVGWDIKWLSILSLVAGICGIVVCVKAAKRREKDGN